MQIALRRTADDTTERRDLMALLGVDPAARFVARTISGSVLTLAFLLVLFGAMTLLFGPDLPGGGWFLVALSAIFMAVGLTELATFGWRVGGRSGQPVDARLSNRGTAVDPSSNWCLAVAGSTKTQRNYPPLGTADDHHRPGTGRDRCCLGQTP